MLVHGMASNARTPCGEGVEKAPDPTGGAPKPASGLTGPWHDARHTLNLLSRFASSSVESEHKASWGQDLPNASVKPPALLLC